MAESRKPRHIKDIAHLYISRLKSPSRGPRSSLLITSNSRNCFSGFHAANLAAAFASKRMNASLFELSGLPANAGYFMALPPHRYIRWNKDEGARSIPGMAGVKISFTLDTRPSFGRRIGRPHIDIIHLPPVFPNQPFQSVIEKVRGEVDKRAVVLFLGMDAGEGLEFLKSALNQSTDWAICNLNLEAGVSDMTAGDRRSSDLGQLGYWEGRLTDRVPIVIRVPESALARTYSSICETILFRINQSKRKVGVSHASQYSRKIRPG
jgi:hypothetical protein